MSANIPCFEGAGVTPVAVGAVVIVAAAVAEGSEPMMMID
jgi:hypothetical protein